MVLVLDDAVDEVGETVDVVDVELMTSESFSSGELLQLVLE